MDEIQLKVPPERVALIVEALQRDIASGAPDSDVTELTQIMVWLRYRLAKRETRIQSKARR